MFYDSEQLNVFITSNDFSFEDDFHNCRVYKVLFCIFGYKASLTHKQYVIYRRKRSDSFSVERPMTEASANRWRRLNVSTAPAENLRCRIVEIDFSRYEYSVLKSARLYDNATDCRHESCNSIGLFVF